MAKKTLGHLLSKDASLNYAEMETLFLRVAHTINSRPLSARVTPDSQWLPITPNDLLHGRATGLEERLTFHFDQELETPLVPRRLEQVQRLEKAWWARWQEDGFALLCPRKKWHTQQRNVKEGDIVLVKYDQKVGNDKFRLARIAQTLPDVHGKVRTVLVEMRNRRKASREKAEVCKAGLLQVRLPVQRLVVILPVEEEWNQGLVSVESPLQANI